MMHGLDGRSLKKITWLEYQKWQRWDEFPERENNPPLTVETAFYYLDNKYIVTVIDNEYLIETLPDFRPVIKNSNFIALLNMPFMNNKSFKELLPEIWFEN